MCPADAILVGARAGLRDRLKPFGFTLKGRKFILENEHGDQIRLSFRRIPVDRAYDRFLVEMAIDPEPTRSWSVLWGVWGIYRDASGTSIWSYDLRWPAGHPDAPQLDFYWSFKIGDDQSRKKCFDLICDTLIDGGWAAWFSKLMVRQNLLDELDGGVWTVPNHPIRGHDFLKAVILFGADPDDPDPGGRLAAFAAAEEGNEDSRLALWMAARLRDLGQLPDDADSATS